MNTLEQSFQDLGAILHRPGMKLIGISGRTTNAREFSGQGIIPQMWGRFYRENLFAIIPHQIGNFTYAAYFDYESEDKGSYSFFIGREVSSFRDIPHDMVSLEVSAMHCLQVTTKKGQLQEIGIEAWQRIWQSQVLRNERLFDKDLEVYGQEAMDPQNAQFDIYIGLK